MFIHLLSERSIFMILNPDCVRLILLFISKNIGYKDGNSECPSIHEEMTQYQIVTDTFFKKQNKSEVAYALELLIKEGYVNCIGRPIYDSNDNLEFARINGLEMKGQSLLNDIDDDSVWEATKKKASLFGRVSIGAMAAGAHSLTTAMMTDPNAIENLKQGVDNFLKLL